MKQVPDRKRLRREYIGKKVTAYSKVILFVASIAIAGYFLMFSMIAMILPPDSHPLRFDLYTLEGIASIVGIVVVSGICILSILAIWFFMNRMSDARQEANSISYVPPVTDADTLPADEILVRGSEEPAVAQSEVLLRAAKEQETPKEELLRVSQE